MENDLKSMGVDDSEAQKDIYADGRQAAESKVVNGLHGAYERARVMYLRPSCCLWGMGVAGARRRRRSRKRTRTKARARVGEAKYEGGSPGPIWYCRGPRTMTTTPETSPEVHNGPHLYCTACAKTSCYSLAPNAPSVRSNQGKTHAIHT